MNNKKYNLLPEIHIQNRRSFLYSLSGYKIFHSTTIINSYRKIPFGGTELETETEL